MVISLRGPRFSAFIPSSGFRQPLRFADDLDAISGLVIEKLLSAVRTFVARQPRHPDGLDSHKQHVIRPHPLDATAAANGTLQELESKRIGADCMAMDHAMPCEKAFARASALSPGA
jgi:hypothetical protein